MNQFIKILVLIGVLHMPISAFAQLQSYSFPEIDSLQSIEKRHIVIFIHTDWCKYCQVMKNTTFTNDRVFSILNENFWFADLNAEEKEDINFYGHTFRYKPNGSNTGVNELAEQLGTVHGKVSYPTLCILNPDYEIIFQYDQFLTTEELKKVLERVMEY